MAESAGEIMITNIEEVDGGDSIVSFDMDEKSTKELAQIGLKFLLYVTAANTTAQTVFEELEQRIPK